MSKRPRVKIYTDGSCLKNPGPGGWAALLIYEVNGSQKVLSGPGPLDTTNNQMELTAVLEALCALKTACKVTIITDSQYVIQVLERIKPPKRNRELWEKIRYQLACHDVTFEHVYGHTGVEGNEIVDSHARREAEKVKYGE